jgi:dTMP kinase
LSEPGHLIAFEGTEGAGKSTQLRRAAVALRALGLSVLETREPGGTPLGKELRRLVMRCVDPPPTPLAELLLYLADRAQHVAQVIRPALRRGQIVLTDRFSASTLAYQGYARRLELAMVKQLDEIARGGVSPTLTLVLDCPVEIGLRRARGDDRFHVENQEFHARVRRGFLAVARSNPQRYSIIDATLPRGRVHEHVMAALCLCLKVP